MSFRDEIDRHLASDDPEAIHQALRVLADAVDGLSASHAKADRLQRLAEQGFREGFQSQQYR